MTEKMAWENIEIQEIEIHEFDIFSQKWADFMKVVREAPMLHEKDKSFLKFIAQIYSFRVIAAINWAKLHVSQDAENNIKAWVYVYKDKIAWILDRIMHRKKSKFQYLIDEGYLYVWYEAGAENQDVVELLTSMKKKLLMIFETEELEKAFLEQGWEFALDKNDQKVSGTKRPERTYVKYNPEKQ